MNPVVWRARLCVLASGSSGNCSVLHICDGDGVERLVLIDAGLSPRRTHRALGVLGVGGVGIAGIVLTHLDHDHWHSGWLNTLTTQTPVWCHGRHAERARAHSLDRLGLEVFDDSFSPWPGLMVEATLGGHDALGSALFRVDVPGATGCLGFATDLGRTHQDITRFLAGVHTLAIESNYCPEMQDSSDRPRFLKDRITGGFGHLSNRQCAEAVRTIDPVSSVVLLHLSRQCNTPERAVLGHVGCPYEVIVSHAVNPTGWLVLGGGRGGGEARKPHWAMATLFDGM